jgi:geranylgeranyl pyrophosphate synthase
VIKNTLEQTKKLIWPEIEKYLNDPIYPTQFTIPARYQKDINSYWKIVREYPERKGKYLRPTLVLLVAGAMGANIKKAIKTATAMQLSEEWLLIHDDLQDNSEKRRGKTTLHRLYGMEMAVNAGDTLATIMWKVLLDNEKVLGPKKTFEIMDEFYKTLLRTEHGQAVEMMWSKKRKEISDSDWYFLADGKTSYYTISLPVRLGAIIAGTNGKQIEKLTEFGLYLGRCFQLIDDILDIETDKKEGKLTIPIIKGVPYAQRLASSLRKKARTIFEKDLNFLSHEPARTQLKEFIDFVLERKY